MDNVCCRYIFIHIYTHTKRSNLVLGIVSARATASNGDAHDQTISKLKYVSTCIHTRTHTPKGVIIFRLHLRLCARSQRALHFPM